MYERIPQELRALPRWVCWQGAPDPGRPGKLRKTPIDPRTGGPAQSNNPGTWCGFEEARAAAPRYSGLGFMLGDGYFGVDLDDCGEALDAYLGGDRDNLAAEFIHTLRSYAEISQSGRGLHILCRGSLPPHGRRRGPVEMYDAGRYFIMTGDAIGGYDEVAEATAAVRPLHEKYIGGGSEPRPQQPAPRLPAAAPCRLEDGEVLQRAERSKQGRLFQDLMAGRWESYFTSQSEADLSLCNALAFWTGRDAAQMDRLFRASGLMRPKWDRRQSGSTYGALTLDKAIRGCTAVYQPEEEYRVTIGNAPPVPPPKRYTFDDTGNAQRLVDAFPDTLRYCFPDREWLYYDSRVWRPDETGVVRRKADEVLEAMGGQLQLYLEHASPEAAPDIEKQFLKHVRASRSNRAKTAMIQEAQHRAPILPAQLDRRPGLLNTPGGVLDLECGVLKQHSATLFLSKMTHVEYLDKMACPLWEAFLADIFDHDQALMAYVQAAVGYSLTGYTTEQCAFFCYGAGRNGKSTFLDTLSDILGDYAVNIQPDTLMVRPAGATNSDIARLKGARFVTSTEPNEGVRLNEGLIKQLTGGDRVTARRLYREEFEFTPEFKLWMATNHKPIIRGTDVGIWRRIHLIPFTVQIPEDRVDKTLKYRLRQEAPAILAWAVEGCRAWRAGGLTPPPAVVSATREYRNEMDVVEMFLQECTVPGGEVGASDLFKAYLQWAEENNEYKMSGNKFGREVSGRYLKRHGRHGWIYVGVSLNKDWQPYRIQFTGP